MTENGSGAADRLVMDAGQPSLPKRILRRTKHSSKIEYAAQMVLYNKPLPIMAKTLNLAVLNYSSGVQGIESTTGAIKLNFLIKRPKML